MPNLRFVRMDIVNRDALSRLFQEEKFDKVMNLAAQAGVRYSLRNPYAYIESNVMFLFERIFVRLIPFNESGDSLRQSDRRTIAHFALQLRSIRIGLIHIPLLHRHKVFLCHNTQILLYLADKIRSNKNINKMTDYLLTALIPMALFFVVLYGSKEAENQNGFMSREYTTIMKAVCCIIVILVHIPAAYTNRLQDAMGSFAYVCVTLFFLMSAYGMSLSKERRRNYMQHFWRNRLAALLIPQLLINICSTIWVYINTQKEYASLFHINNYVVVLLGYCFWFWLVYQGRRWYGHRIANTLLVGGVIISSLGSYFFMEKDANYWCYERWGLVWGVLLYLFLPEIKKRVCPSKNRILLFGVLSLVLGVAYLYFKTVFFWGEYLLKVVLGVVLITLLFILSSKRTLGNRVADYLGDISYEVYLSHGFVMGVIEWFHPELSSGVFILSTVIITICFSAAVHTVGKVLVKWCRA